MPLINREYEVYILENHRQIQIIDKSYINPVIFINIDEKLSTTEWDRIISNYCSPGREQNLKLGILSYNENKNIELKYNNLLKITSGFHTMRQRSDDLLNNITHTLDLQNVKENRRFIRASFEAKQYLFELIYKDIKRIGYINDLSSVGMTIVFDKPFIIEKNSLLNNITLYIKESKIQVSGVFLGAQRDVNDKVIYVIIFDKSMSEVSRSRIRLMINRYHQELFTMKIKQPIR